jgi:predicted transport protein
LRLNQGLGELEGWNAEAIKDRGARLAERALTVWASPQLSEDERKAYAPARRSSGPNSYTLDGHPHLAQPGLRAVFDALDTRIRDLDPNVYQEVLKLYIAYKCETNFVDIVPQAKGLRISLNMPFLDLDDPRGLAKNVAGLGRWGNGEVELRVNALEEVPYAIGLIRQSLDRQLDDAPEAP